MTEPIEGSSPRETPRGFFRWISGPFAAKALTTITVVGTLAGVGSFFIDLWGSPGQQAPPSATSPAPAPRSVSNGAAALPETPPPGDGAIRAGDCLTAAGMTIGCHASHVAEVFATDGNCTPEDLVKFTGGIFKVDVLRSDLEIKQVASVEACAVIVPPELAASGSIRNLLSTEDHPALRQCSNRLTGRVLACDQVHTAEVVFADPDPGVSAVSCIDKANEYMGGSWSRHAQKLDIVTATSGPSVTCSVQAKGANALVGSLRNLGTTALPLGPLD